MSGVSFETVLAALRGVRRSGDSATARCPAHDDRQNSLSVSRGANGRVLLHCFAGCDFARIADALGLRQSDLCGDKTQGRGEVCLPQELAQPCNRATPGCTLAAYAESKRLPVEFLADVFGLTEITYGGAPALRTPYRDANGTEIAIRFRTALTKGDGVDDRFRWKNGSKPALYGLWKLAAIRDAGEVVLVEGESCTHTLAFCGEPAIGVPRRYELARGMGEASGRHRDDLRRHRA
jgi:hypothetical protein